jgi:hypothetical protein
VELLGTRQVKRHEAEAVPNVPPLRSVPVVPRLMGVQERAEYVEGSNVQRRIRDVMFVIVLR